MGIWFGRLTGAVCVVFALAAGEVGAQPLGTFSWQQQPYCNVLTVSVTQDGAVYTLDGYDDQCGGAQRASAVGTALLNPNGTVGIGATIVLAPGATPVHVEATINVASLSGTWHDSGGSSGPFVFTPGMPVPGSPRPVPTASVPSGSITAAQLAPGAVDTTKILDGTIAAADINAAQVQRRVTGVCGGGALMTGVNADGSVACTPAGIQSHAVGNGQTSTAVGIEALAALTSGGYNTAVGLRALDESTTGNYNTAVGAGSLGENTIGASNTGLGYLALSESTSGTGNTAVGTAALSSNLIADYNTAVGANALDDNTTGAENTAVGRNSLARSTEGDGNSAFGARALDSNVSGNTNAAIGVGALQANTTGNSNVALGSALGNVTSGSGNIGVGNGAGALITTGNDNIFVGGAAATVSESNTTRIGGANQSRAFMAGIRGTTTGQNNAVSVVVDSSGQLGTVSSSRRMKEDITPMGGFGRRLQQLRPVRFRYIDAFANGSKPVQYGLIAEEVAEVIPELVAFGADGAPETVLYHVLPSLLIEEVQRLQRELDELRESIRTDRARANGGRR